MSRNHQYAQHFLRSPQLVAELIGHTNIRRNDTVYDLGAGSGVISSVLARRCRTVIASEIEPHALKKLRDNMRETSNVEILTEDVLSLSPEAPYKIFANIPFSLSSQIVQHFLFEVTPPKSMYLIVQKQFARKIIPSNAHFTSSLGIELAPWFTGRIRKPLKRTDFTPPPNVDTVLLEVKPRESALLPDEHQSEYRAFVQRSFASQPYFQSLRREKSGISPELRPSQLTVEQWLSLYRSTKNLI